MPYLAAKLEMTTIRPKRRSRIPRRHAWTTRKLPVRLTDRSRSPALQVHRVGGAEDRRQPGVGDEHVDVVQRRKLVGDEIDLVGAAGLAVERDDVEPAASQASGDRRADPARAGGSGHQRAGSGRPALHPLGHRQAAAHRQRLARDVARLLGGEEAHGGGDVLGLGPGASSAPPGPGAPAPSRRPDGRRRRPGASRCRSGPGQTMLAVTPVRAVSRATVLVKEMIAPLAPAYTDSSDEPTRARVGADVDDPSPAALDHRWQQRPGQAQAALEVDLQHLLPELLVGLDERLELVPSGDVDERRRSRRTPHARASRPAATLSGLRTSISTASARPPASVIRWALSRACSVRMSPMIVAMPSSARPRAIAAPIPRAPPVTRATRAGGVWTWRGTISCASGQRNPPIGGNWSPRNILTSNYLSLPMPV